MLIFAPVRNTMLHIQMTAIPENLASLKDDMIAFIEGHGLRRFHGYVDPEEVPCVKWTTEENPDGWKDFVELAKAAGAPFLTMDSWELKREELDELIGRLEKAEFPDDEDIEEARWLRTYAGKTGFVQLGFGYQGSMMLYETATEWYDRFQHLIEFSDDFGGITMDGFDQDEEI